jgi:hypothetical protein
MAKISKGTNSNVVLNLYGEVSPYVPNKAKKKVDRQLSDALRLHATYTSTYIFLSLFINDLRLSMNLQDVRDYEYCAGVFDADGNTLCSMELHRSIYLLLLAELVSDFGY